MADGNLTSLLATSRRADIWQRKSIRLIICSELPKNWNIRKKVAIAKQVTNSFKVISHKDFKLQMKRSFTSDLKDFNKTQIRFKRLVYELDEMIELSDISDLIISAGGQTEISVEEINKVLSVFLLAAKKITPYPIEKQKSKNRATPRGEFDLHIGNILISQGVTRRRSSVIIAMIRMKHPFTVPRHNQEIPTLVINLKKEVRAIEQRLRDNGL